MVEILDHIAVVVFGDDRCIAIECSGAFELLTEQVELNVRVRGKGQCAVAAVDVVVVQGSDPGQDGLLLVHRENVEQVVERRAKVVGVVLRKFIGIKVNKNLYNSVECIVQLGK